MIALLLLACAVYILVTVVQAWPKSTKVVPHPKHFDQLF